MDFIDWLWGGLFNGKDLLPIITLAGWAWLRRIR